MVGIAAGRPPESVKPVLDEHDGMVRYHVRV